jgi:hypothetical protein
MTNEAKAERLEAMALGKQRHAKDWSNGAQMNKMLNDASALLEGAMAIRERGEDGWHKQYGRTGNRIAIRNGFFLKITAPYANQQFWTWLARGYGSSRRGYRPTLNAAKAAAIAWVDANAEDPNAGE